MRIRRARATCAAVLLPLLVAACDKVSLVVPLRVCVVQGSAFAPAAQAPNIPVLEARVHELLSTASAFWIEQAGIGILAYPDVLVIQDPTPTVTPRQKVGDVVQDLGLGGPTQESLDMIQACDTEWARLPTGKPPGVTLVFARDFASQGGGVNISMLGFTPAIGTASCTAPYHIDPTFVRSRWSIVKTNLNGDHTPAQWQKSIVGTIEHEFGHILLLRHGNGKDDDANGVWDEECDAKEYSAFDLKDPQTSFNLMAPQSSVSTGITALQVALARAAAVDLTK